MITMFTGKKAALLALALVAALFVAAPFAMAQEEAHGAEAAETEEIPADPNTLGNGLRILGLALGAGIAIAGGAIATARAQAAVGAGGTGALAEKPELFGNILILFAIPETLVIFAFVIAIMLWVSI